MELSPDGHAKFLPETPASANMIDAHDGVRGYPGEEKVAEYDAHLNCPESGNNGRSSFSYLRRVSFDARCVQPDVCCVLD